MAEISIPTFEQLSTIMSHLLTNYTELIRVYWDMFYSTEPQTLTLKVYNEDGELVDIEIPNRAKDFNFIQNGEGSPEGAVSAAVGTTYQDTLNGKLYIKELGDGNTGWKLIGSDESIIKGNSNPEGLIVGAKGDIYEDKTNCSLYIKTTETGNEGWLLINADVTNLANRDLSNLSHVGRNVLNAKEDQANKIQSITAQRTDKYPSEKAVNTYVTSKTNVLANRDLTNLTPDGEAHFANPALGNLSPEGQEKFFQKANVDLDNLSEIGEGRINKAISYSINHGNTDGYGNLDLIAVETSFDTTYEFTSPGTYTINVPRDGVFSVEAVSGGSGGAHLDGYLIGVRAEHYYYVGSTGGYFKGTVRLTAGTHTVVVGAGGAGGNAGNGYAGGATSIDSGFVLAGAAGGGHNYGAGGSLTTSSIVESTEANNAGYGTYLATHGHDLYGVSYGAQAAPVPGNLAGFGRGGGTGNTSGGYAGSGGYLKIIVAGAGSTEANYKIDATRPLEIVKKSGETKVIYGVNNDQLTGLPDGRYNKFVDETGSDFYNNTIYRGYSFPASPNVNDVFVRKTMPIEVYKFNGTTWEDYSKIFIGSVTLSNGSVSTYNNAYLCDNGFNSTLYNRQVMKVGNIGGYWYRLYSDGWCEQGGIIAGNIGTTGNITLPIPYKDTLWCPVASCTSGTITVESRGTTTTISWTKSNAAAYGFWVAYGFARADVLNYTLTN